MCISALARKLAANVEIIEEKLQTIKGTVSSFEGRISALETTTRSIKKDLKVLDSKKEKEAPSSDEGEKCKKKKAAVELKSSRDPDKPIPYIRYGYATISRAATPDVPSVYVL